MKESSRRTGQHERTLRTASILILWAAWSCAEGQRVDGVQQAGQPFRDGALASPDAAMPGVCSANEKLCNGECVLVSPVVAGCQNTACAPCPTMPGFTAYCDPAGQCTLQCNGPDCSGSGGSGAGGSGGMVGTGGLAPTGGALPDSGIGGGGVPPASGGAMPDASVTTGGAPPSAGGATGGGPMVDASTGGVSNPGTGGSGGMQASGGAGGSMEACPGYPTDNACAACVCEQCASQVDACVNSPDATKNQHCLAIRQCADQNNCTGTPCYCGTDTASCLSNPSGPCVAEIDSASGNADLAELQDQLADPSTAVGRSADVSDCALANCTAQCGYQS